MSCKSKTDRPTDKQTNRLNNIIAIDGPAGSGKSTVAKEVARRLRFLYVDTGAMYRALALKALKEAVNLEDEQALVGLAKKTNIQLRMKQGFLVVVLDGQDVSKAIRHQSITEKVRYVAKVPGVRKQMVRLQRRLAKEAGSAVLEGRDIGTVVFPHARYKFYLDAQPAERVRRRYKELVQMGEEISFADVCKDIEMRDKSDMTREVAPLVKAKDAVYIDTTNSSVEEVAKEIIQRCFI